MKEETIKRLLELEEKATPGVWYLDEDGERIFSARETETKEVINSLVGYQDLDDSIMLILESRNHIRDLCLSWLDQKKKLEKAIEALEFYSSDERYQGRDIVDGIEVLEINEDSGDKARQVLKEIRE